MTGRSIARMRPYGSGSLSVRQTTKGPQFYGQWWYAPGKKTARRLGPVRQPGSKAGLTEKMANAKLAAAIAEFVPPDDNGPGIRMQEASKIYRAHLKRQGRKKATITAVESCLRIWATPHLGDKPLDCITYHDIDAMIAEMERAGDGKRPLSPKSIANHCGTISALFTYGMDEKRKWTTTNPVKSADLPAVESGDDIRFLEPEQIDTLIRAVPDTLHHGPGRMHTYENPYAELDRVLYVVAAMTGMRQGELIALRWGAVDWPARKIRVRRNYVLGEDIEPKSNKSKRAVPMGDRVAKALAAWQPHDATDDDLVFADPMTGGYLANAAILRRFRIALREAGLPANHRFHDLRHTFATRMAAQGVALVALQAWMGHADIQTTMRYADYAPSAHEAEMVDAAFAPPVSGGRFVGDLGPLDREEAQ